MVFGSISVWSPDCQKRFLVTPFLALEREQVFKLCVQLGKLFGMSIQEQGLMQWSFTIAVAFWIKFFWFLLWRVKVRVTIRERPEWRICRAFLQIIKLFHFFLFFQECGVCEPFKLLFDLSKLCFDLLDFLLAFLCFLALFLQFFTQILKF